jgi:hypothetical protein
MTKSTQLKKRSKKKRYIILVLIAIIIILRLLLPRIVKGYVNKTLANVPGYYGQVEDIDISLLRGAYIIKGLYLNTVNAQTQIPFLNFPKIDISVQWKSLFKGKIVSEIIMFNPEVTYVLEDQSEINEDSDLNDWTKILTDLVPLEINNFTIYKGKIGLVKATSDPALDVYMHQVEFTADNLRNVIQQELVLPSTIRGSGVSIGGGRFDIDGAMNLIKTIPDLNIDFELTEVDVTSVNGFARNYGGLDFEKGKIDIYGEIAIANSYLKGYVKPLLKESKLIGKDDDFLNTVWEGFVGLFKFLLKNKETRTFATKVPLEGDLENVEAGVWPTVINIFKNGWIQAFNQEVDQDIDFIDALQQDELDGLSRKERRASRKIQRQKKREEKEKKKQ